MHALNNVPTVIENPPDILCVHGTREVRVAVVPSISTCCADSLCRARDTHWVKMKIPTGGTPTRPQSSAEWRRGVHVWAVPSTSATEWQNAHRLFTLNMTFKMIRIIRWAGHCKLGNFREEWELRKISLFIHSFGGFSNTTPSPFDHEKNRILPPCIKLLSLLYRKPPSTFCFTPFQNESTVWLPGSPLQIIVQINNSKKKKKNVHYSFSWPVMGKILQKSH